MSALLFVFHSSFELYSAKHAVLVLLLNIATPENSSNEQMVLNLILQERQGAGKEALAAINHRIGNLTACPSASV